MSNIHDIIIEELESVFRCDEHTEDELQKRYDDLYESVGNIFKKLGLSKIYEKEKYK